MNIFKHQRAEELLIQFINFKQSYGNGDIKREIEECGYCYITEYLPNLTVKEFKQVVIAVCG